MKNSFYLLALLFPATTFAYVGPGAGISMLGSLWGLIIAVVFVIFGLLVLPIKIMRNKRKKQKAEAAAAAENAQQQTSAEEEEKDSA